MMRKENFTQGEYVKKEDVVSYLDYCNVDNLKEVVTNQHENRLFSYMRKLDGE